MLPDGLKINIGCGNTVIDGYIGIDRKFGGEMVPLTFNDGTPVPDESCSDLRASHCLEHLNFAEAEQAMREWHRVLKPGGRLRIAVPDVRKVIRSIDTEPHWCFHLMGGQTDANDFHKSAFDETRLRGYFAMCGYENVAPWSSPNTDTASHPCSLNLEGYKTATAPATIKITAVTSIPRVGWNDHWGCVQEALSPFKIPLRRFTGAFWGQCMQRVLNECVADGLDWVLCLDYDTLFTAEHVSRLMDIFAQRPDIDAIAALQCRRQGDTPLMTMGKEKETEVTGQPILVTTAHFGLTLLRVDALRETPKPWFKSEPDADGEWGDGRIDDDIWFWAQWRKSGHTIYVAPDVRVGHLQLMATEFNAEMQVEDMHVTEWQRRYRKVVAK